MKIKATGCMVLVRLDDVEEVTKGGIVLARETVDKEQGGCVSGVVKGLGPDAFDRSGSPHDVKVGDRVVFQRYAGFIPYLKDVPEDVARKWSLMNDEDIKAVLSDEGVELT